MSSPKILYNEQDRDNHIVSIINQEADDQHQDRSCEPRQRHNKLLVFFSVLLKKLGAPSTSTHSSHIMWTRC